MAYQKDHTYWVISYGGNGRALSVYGNSQVSENRNVILWDKQNIKDQLWLVKVGSGFARLHTTLDTSYTLNVWRGADNMNNCDIHTYDRNLEDSKIDFITINSDKNLYRIKLLNYDLYLTATSNSNGADVRWSALTGGNNQLWKLVLSSGTTPPTGSNLVWPVEGRSMGSGFRTQDRPSHDGIDIPAPAGTPIKAIADGVVSKVGTPTTNPSEGYTVRINHDASPNPSAYPYLRSYYLHMKDTPPVTLGQHVKAGETIGYVGNTGNSYGNHLHLGIRYSNTPFTVNGNFYEGVDFIDPQQLF